MARIQINENDIRQMVTESVKRILKEEKLKGYLLNPPKESLWRTELKKIYDEVDEVCETLNLTSDYSHTPYIYIFRDALRHLYMKDYFGDYTITQNDVNKYKKEWEYIKQNQCYDEYF